MSDPRVAATSLTGSGEAGKAHAALSAKYLKKCRLELGGSDPFIVLDDADLAKASENGAMARLFNAGQVCCGSKRYLVHEKIYEEYIALLIKEIEKLPVGDPTKPTSKVGPLARRDLLERLKKQALKSIEMGAKLRYGDIAQLTKVCTPEEGNYFTPIILENIPNGSPAAEEGKISLEKLLKKTRAFRTSVFRMEIQDRRRSNSHSQ